jgi:hypothetical protein
MHFDRAVGKKPYRGTAIVTVSEISRRTVFDQ